MLVVTWSCSTLTMVPGLAACCSWLCSSVCRVASAVAVPGNCWLLRQDFAVRRGGAGRTSRTAAPAAAAPTHIAGTRQQHTEQHPHQPRHV